MQSAARTLITLMTASNRVAGLPCTIVGGVVCARACAAGPDGDPGDVTSSNILKRVIKMMLSKGCTSETRFSAMAVAGEPNNYGEDVSVGKVGGVFKRFSGRAQALKALRSITR